MNKIIYFDNAATTSVDENVLKEMIPYFTINYGNPSSLYSLGRMAKRKVEEAREKIAKELNAKKNEIFFTSGGSESDNLAIKGVARALKHKGNHIITSKIEHPAVLNTCKSLEKEGFEITYLNVNENGKILLNELENAITPKTILISIMFANNEIGTIEPIKEIGLIAKKHNIYFHTDAVQAVGNVKIDVKNMNIDLLSLSGHKLHAPKGIGVLYIKDGVSIQKLQDGGHQERDIRAGTENVPGIIGLGKAIEIAYRDFDKKVLRIKNLRDYCIERLQKEFKEIRINGNKIDRLPGNINVSFKNIAGDELLYLLDEKGICVSGGSACSSGSTLPSHVLLAIGVNKEYIDGTIRITIGDKNIKSEIDYLISILKEIKELKA